jgi:hypothetical protein
MDELKWGWVETRIKGRLDGADRQRLFGLNKRRGRKQVPPLLERC